MFINSLFLYLQSVQKATVLLDLLTVVPEEVDASQISICRQRTGRSHSRVTKTEAVVLNVHVHDLDSLNIRAGFLICQRVLLSKSFSVKSV